MTQTVLFISERSHDGDVNVSVSPPPPPGRTSTAEVASPTDLPPSPEAPDSLQHTVNDEFCRSAEAVGGFSVACCTTQTAHMEIVQPRDDVSVRVECSRSKVQTMKRIARHDFPSLPVVSWLSGNGLGPVVVGLCGIRLGRVVVGPGRVVVGPGWVMVGWAPVVVRSGGNGLGRVGLRRVGLGPVAVGLRRVGFLRVGSGPHTPPFRSTYHDV